MLRFLKSKFKKYETASFDKQKHIAEQYLDIEGNAVVRIHLKTVSDAYSEFCTEGYEELSPDLTDYLDSVIYHIPLENPVVLLFHIDSATSAQEETLTQTIINHYGLVLEDKMQDLKINSLTILSLFLLGAVLLVFSYYLSSNNKTQLFTDIINIAGTFALWEMVDLYILDRQVKKLEKLNAAQTATAKIGFEN